MHPIASRLFFTNKATIKTTFGQVIEVEGEFLNWFGRNLLFVVFGMWAALMLAAAYLHT